MIGSAFGSYEQIEAQAEKFRICRNEYKNLDTSKLVNSLAVRYLFYQYQSAHFKTKQFNQHEASACSIKFLEQRDVDVTDSQTIKAKTNHDIQDSSAELSRADHFPQESFSKSDDYFDFLIRKAKNVKCSDIAQFETFIMNEVTNIRTMKTFHNISELISKTRAEECKFLSKVDLQEKVINTLMITVYKGFLNLTKIIKDSAELIIVLDDQFELMFIITTFLFIVFTTTRYMNILIITVLINVLVCFVTSIKHSTLSSNLTLLIAYYITVITYGVNIWLYNLCGPVKSLFNLF